MKTVQYKTFNGNVGSDSLTTLFEYDGINQLVKVTDATNKTTESIFDLAGRRTQVKHPASGTTTFKYDLAGNLTEKLTANLKNVGAQPIKYQYDFNRLKEINYPLHPENDVKYVYGTKDETGSTNFYRAGRLKYLEDGSGAQEYKYGKQGEVTELRRTLVIPNQAVATYVTKTAYDSWNRLLSMTYPDGEMVNYTYNTGGLLTGVSSASNLYVADVKYDKFEQRTYLKYGNGKETNYTYDDRNRQLKYLKVGVGDQYIMNNTYSYDAVGNVSSITNTGIEQDAASTVSHKIGGKINHTYTYDNLYRLETAHGEFNDGGAGRTATYTLNMEYDNMHNITKKKQDISQTGIQFAGTLNAGYELNYTINAANSQQISNIADANYRYEGVKQATPPAEASSNKKQEFSYDANGNLIYTVSGTVKDNKLQAANTRKLLWDEENRLLGISDNGFVSNYWYDAAGERTVKESFDNEGVYVNGALSGARTGTSKFTAYISPYVIVSQGGNYTKHIYMGSQRITSKVSNSGIFAASPVNTTDLQAKLTLQTTNIKERFDSLGVKYSGTTQTGGLVSASPATTADSYFYHPDHLGSSSLITNGSGDLVQHIQYVPFGEVFVEERNASWSTPYKFNGKEQDEETGLSYYGARYYDPRTSVWLSVDPMAEKFAGRSSYEFSLSNPIKFIDFNGMDPTEDEAKAISSHVYGDQKDNTLIGGWKLKERYKETDNGMKSALYVRMSEDKKTELEYCYATAGTEPSDLKRDGKADVLQTIGLSNQFKESISKAKELRNTYGDKLSFTGHSLGGALASANALTTGGNAQSYNSAWLRVATKLRFDLNNKNGQIDAYINVTDYVTWGQILLKGLINPEGNIHLRIPANINSWGHSINNDMKPIDIKERIMGVMDAINQRANPANYIKGF